VRILSHYFAARFLGLFAAVLVAALFLLGTIELVLNLDDLSRFAGDASEPPSSEAGAGNEFGAAFRYLWLRLLSYYLADLLPIASFIAAFIAFAWAGRALELLAVQAGGVRLIRIVAPVLVCAVILSLAAALLHETVILRAGQSWASEAQDGRDQIDFSRTAFWFQKGRTITRIHHADPATHMLHGVEVFERGTTGTIVRVIQAERVRIGEDGSWHVEEARIWTFDPNDASAEPSLAEQVWTALDLESLGSDALLGADPASLPLPGLASYLEANRLESSSNLRRLTSRYHARLSSPWLVLVFAWLALPFALRVDQRGRFVWPALAAIGTLALFFLLRSAGTTLAREAFVPAGLTPWLTMGVFGIGAAIALRRQSL
jgi:lipopolysaccharide export LptBFGC system permease protein LptF